MTARLEVIGVTVRFGELTALDRVSLTVAAGEVVALLGPSGSGKSTLLRVIAGLVAPDGGAVRLDGRDVTAVPTHRRGVGLVFQDEQLFNHLDVAANVAYGLKARGDAPAARRARVTELLALVGLTGFEPRRVTELSGGEAKRVAVARSLAPSPRLLLLDEPLTGLDRELHDRLAGDLAGIIRAEAMTALIVTHDREEAAVVADRIVTVDALGSGPPARRAETVTVADVRPLRRAVLRRGTPTDDVTFPGDDDPTTRHLAVRDGTGAVIAASTWMERPSPDRPDRRGLQLRGMAVADVHQGRGLGAVLVEAGVALAAERGISVVWAHARDSALDFYAAQGFGVVGEGFLTADTQLPHHRIVRDLPG